MTRSAAVLCIMLFFNVERASHKAVEARSKCTTPGVVPRTVRSDQLYSHYCSAYVCRENAHLAVVDAAATRASCLLLRVGRYTVRRPTFRVTLAELSVFSFDGAGVLSRGRACAHTALLKS